MRRTEFIKFCSPSILLMIIVITIPLIGTIVISFQDFTLGGSQGKYIGMQNYYEVLKSDRFYNAMINTFIYVGISVPFQILIGFTIALLLSQNLKFRSFFLGSTLLPHILTPVVAALLFSWLFREQWGYYDYLLSKMGIRIGWYSQAWPARFLLIQYEIWKETPFVILVLFAGLQSLPREPYEAALVDGANWFQRLIYITIPLLTPLFVFVSLMRIMDAYRNFDNVFVMTGGGPGTATELITFYNYVVAFRHLELGKGAAISVITAVIILLLLGPFVVQVYKEQLRQD